MSRGQISRKFRHNTYERWTLLFYRAFFLSFWFCSTVYAVLQAVGVTVHRLHAYYMPRSYMSIQYEYCPFCFFSFRFFHSFRLIFIYFRISVNIRLRAHTCLSDRFVDPDRCIASIFLPLLLLFVLLFDGVMCAETFKFTTHTYYLRLFFVKETKKTKKTERHKRNRNQLTVFFFYMFTRWTGQSSVARFVFVV